MDSIYREKQSGKAQEGEGSGWLEVAAGSEPEVVSEGSLDDTVHKVDFEFRLDSVLVAERRFEGTLVFNTQEDDADVDVRGEFTNEGGEDQGWVVFEHVQVEDDKEIYYYGESWAWR